MAAAIVALNRKHRGSDQNEEAKVLDSISRLPAVEKLANPQSQDLLLDELDTLCEAIGKNDDGTVNLGKLRDVLVPVLDLLLDAGTNAEKEVNAFLGMACAAEGGDPNNLADTDIEIENLHKSLIQERKVLKRNRLSGHAGDKSTRRLNRDFMVTRIANFTDTSDAIVTLPITLVYIIVFVFLVITHLRIFDRSQTEKAIEEWINGRDPLTDCENNVDNMDAFWGWLTGQDGDNGIIGVLGDQRNTSAGFQYALASKSVLIGDVQLSYSKFSGSEGSVWLIHSDVGQSHLQANPHDYLGAAQAAAGNLQSNGWDASDIEKMWFSFSTYDEEKRMFSITQVIITFEDTGRVDQRINTETVLADPYPSTMPLIYAWDTLFFIIVMYLAITEIRDICLSLRMGFSEFIDYWKFWNCVDWVGIVMGGCSACVWIACMSLMWNDVLVSLCDDDGIVKVDVMSLTEAQIVDITDHLWKLRDVLWLLHWVMALNTVSIVSKFFKAFTANKKLTVVTDTLKLAYDDFFHYLVVFSTLFLPFAIIGHILFGNDIEGFNSMFASINLGFLTLMAGFDFYADAMEDVFLSEQLDSGMPAIFLTLWYVAFMFLLFLVLLNMLLAIIIENYTTINNNIKATLPEFNPPIWKQCYNFSKYKKETRKFVSLEHIRRQLEDDDEPAHMDDVDEVTEATLMKAFETHGMIEDQSQWLMKFLNDHFKLILRQDKRDARKGTQHMLMPEAETIDENLEQAMNVLRDCKAPVGDEAVGRLADIIKQLKEDVDKVVVLQETIQEQLKPLVAQYAPDQVATDTQPTTVEGTTAAKINKDMAKTPKKKKSSGRSLNKVSSASGDQPSTPGEDNSATDAREGEAKLVVSGEMGTSPVAAHDLGTGTMGIKQHHKDKKERKDRKTHKEHKEHNHHKGAEE